MLKFELPRCKVPSDDDLATSTRNTAELSNSIIYNIELALNKCVAAISKLEEKVSKIEFVSPESYASNMKMINDRLNELEKNNSLITTSLHAIDHKVNYSVWDKITKIEHRLGQEPVKSEDIKPKSPSDTVDYWKWECKIHSGAVDLLHKEVDARDARIKELEENGNRLIDIITEASGKAVARIKELEENENRLIGTVTELRGKVVTMDAEIARLNRVVDSYNRGDI